MVDFVTCLNVAQGTPVRLVAGEDSVELDCHGTEIEMPADSLEQLLTCVEQALPRLTTPLRQRTLGARAVSTWVLCDPDTPPHCALLDDVLEVRWGPVVLTLNKSALPEVIRQGREAQAELAQRRAESVANDRAGRLNATA